MFWHQSNVYVDFVKTKDREFHSVFAFVFALQKHKKKNRKSTGFDFLSKTKKKLWIRFKF